MDHPHNREERQAAASEFDLIRRHFQHPERSARRDVVAGVGDDAALLEPPPGMELAATVDTLLAGVHYPESTAPEDVGYKALAVNLSDLAAMGAAPAWATLALTLPAADEAWLHGFSTGLFSLAGEYGVALVGGDTTRGPMTAVTLQLLGLVPKGEALRRGGANAGDRIHVTGTLGDAALALRLLQEGAPVPAPLRRRLDRPEPRVAQGAALRGVASACIDISDGLLADLGHLLEASGVGATVELERIPLSESYRAHAARLDDPHAPALTGGDDYELCFTVPPERVAELERRFARQGWPCHCIGVVEERPGVRCRFADGREHHPTGGGYDHFSRR